MNAISGCGIKTFYIITKNVNLWSLTMYLLGVDMIEIANSKLIMKNVFLYDIKKHKYWPICSWYIRVFLYMIETWEIHIL